LGTYLYRNLVKSQWWAR